MYLLKKISCFLTIQVGLGEAGKTSLLRSLIGGYTMTPQVTDGISIEEWNLDLEDQTVLSYSMWDFGKLKLKINFFFNY